MASADDTELPNTPNGNHGNQPDALSSVINEEFLTCKICFSPLERPKILDCLHSFCHQCLSNHVDQNDLIDLLPCPLCRQRTPIPNGVIDLKDNFLLLSLQEAVVLNHSTADDIKGRACDSCNSRGEQRPCLKKCLDCKEHLCQECIEAHQRLNLTKHHKMVALDAAETDHEDGSSNSHTPSPDTSKPRMLHCSDHPDEECKLYCEVCHTVLCITCRLTSHDGHKCCGFDQAASREKQHLSKWLGFIQSRITKYEGILDDWRKYKVDLERQKCGTQAQIDHRCQELHTLVDGWHYATSKQLEAVYKDENKHVQSKLDQVEVSLGTNHGLFQLTETILQYTSPINFLTLRTQLVQDLGKLQRENLNALCHTQRSVFSFNEGQKILNFDHMGEFCLSQEKVLTGVQIQPIQSLTFVREFLTREQSSGSRFDASSVSVGPGDEIIVTDRQMDKITRMSITGEVLQQLNVFLMGKPVYALALASGDTVFSRDKQSVCVFSAGGQHRMNLKDHMSKPCSLCVDNDSIIYVLDYNTKIVTKFRSETYTKVAHIKLQYKKSSIWDKICINSQGNIYLCAFAENCIYEFTATGQKLAQYGRWGSSDPGELYWPRGMCVDDHDNIIVADTNNGRLQMLTPQGAWVLLETPQGHSVTSPSDVAITNRGHLCVLEKCAQVLMFQYLTY